MFVMPTSGHGYGLPSPPTIVNGQGVTVPLIVVQSTAPSNSDNLPDGTVVIQTV